MAVEFQFLKVNPGNGDLKQILSCATKSRNKSRDKLLKSLQRAAIAGTEIKQKDKLCKAEKRKAIASMEKHNETNLKDNTRKAEKLKALIGAEEHDVLKQRDNRRKADERKAVFGTAEHDQIKQKDKAWKQLNRKRKAELLNEKEAKKRKLHYFDENIKNFREKINEGPVFICVVCNRSLFRRSVILFKDEKYDLPCKLQLNFVLSFDGQYYVCKTCHTKLRKGKIPDIAVSNKLGIYDLPDQFPPLRKLERAIIAKRILFKNVVTLGKGNFIGIVIVKLKTKMANKIVH